MKRIAIVDITDERQRQKTLKEVRLLQRLDHPNIIKYLDAFIDEHDLIIVFEWAEAGDLKRQLRKAREKKVRFDERLVWRYFSQICSAIQYMHNMRVMHRDLKPQNLLVSKTLKTIKIADFGLARTFTPAGRPLTMEVITRWYRAPEIMLNVVNYTKSIDVWSAGCIFAEFFTRKPILMGNDYRDQLNKTFDMFGTPTADELEIITSAGARRFVSGLPPKPAVPPEETRRVGERGGKKKRASPNRRPRSRPRREATPARDATPRTGCALTSRVRTDVPRAFRANGCASRVCRRVGSVLCAAAGPLTIERNRSRYL